MSDPINRDDMDAFVRSVMCATAGKRFCRASERTFQDGLEQCFLAAGMSFVREHRLDDRDRPDFFFSNSVAVECKVKGGVESHLRQMKRYAAHSTVAGVLLLAMRPHGPSMPDTLNDKPISCLNFAPKCL